MTNKQLYIAYGSNLDIYQMGMRCPGALVVGKTWLHDYRLVFQGNRVGAHANVIPEEGQDVPVVIWEITQSDESTLDIYEGVRGGYYSKEYMDVVVRGKLRNALIYIMRPSGYGMPSDTYLQTIAQGYRDFHMDINVLNEAVRHTYDKIKVPVRLGSMRKEEQPWS